MLFEKLRCFCLFGKWTYPNVLHTNGEKKNLKGFLLLEIRFWYLSFAAELLLVFHVNLIFVLKHSILKKCVKCEWEKNRNV